MDTIPYRRKADYPQIANLVHLLIYASQHSHSGRWIPAILSILARKGAANG